MLKIYTADCTFLKDPDEWERRVKLVSPSRRDRIISFRSQEDRCRSLAASLLLRAALREEGISYEDISIRQGIHGKPELEGCSLHFNISHGGKLAMCALADRQVGADIESLFRFDGKKSRMQGIAKKCLNEKERILLEQSDKREKDMIRIWTKKESFVKMTGEGLSRDLATVDTLQGGYFEQRILEDEYCATVCTGDFCGPGIWQKVRWNKGEQEAVLTCMMN